MPREHPGAFERLVRIVRFEVAEGWTGEPIPEVELQIAVKPNDLSIGLKVGKDDLIPGVAIQSSTTVDGGGLDDLAERMLDDLAERALRVGRQESEPRIRPARGR